MCLPRGATTGISVAHRETITEPAENLSDFYVICGINGLDRLSLIDDLCALCMNLRSSFGCMLLLVCFNKEAGMTRRSQNIDLFLSVQRDADLLTGSKLMMIQVLFEDLCASLSSAQGHGVHQALERRQLALAHAQKIIKGLQLALDTSKQSELSSILGQLYSYMGARLWHAHVHRDNQAIGEVLSLTRTLTNAWRNLPQKPVAPMAGQAQSPPAWSASHTYMA
jgi:flagellar biosynthetic protein FliS